MFHYSRNRWLIYQQHFCLFSSPASVMSATTQTTWLCSATELAWHGTEWRANASQSLNPAQRLSPEKRLREVSIKSVYDGRTVWMELSTDLFLFFSSFCEKISFSRAITHITGFVLRSRAPEMGCILNYVAQCDPQGKLPPWLVNKVTHTLGPRMVKDLRKAALGYIEWKNSQSHFRKPWRYPEDITVPRILITDCWDPVIDVIPAAQPAPKSKTTVSLPSTPTQQIKPLKLGNIQTNGDVYSSSATNSPVSQKKIKKKFKFKFDREK